MADSVSAATLSMRSRMRAGGDPVHPNRRNRALPLPTLACRGHGRGMRAALVVLAIIILHGTGHAEERPPLPFPGPAEEPRLPTIIRAHPTEMREPPSWIGWLVGGSLATAAGVVNLAGSGLCFATLPQAQRVPCGATSVAFGLAGVGVGIPLMVIGAEKRASWLERVKVAPSREGAVFGWGGRF